MTLNDIIVAALAQLDRGHDAQTLDTWRDKFTRFANEAVADMSTVYKPYTTEIYESTDGLLDTAALTHGCRKLLSIRRNGQAEAFMPGPASGTVRLAGGAGTVAACYQYVPAEMQAPSDVPDLPAWCHGLIVCYVVGRERASGDVSQQRGGNIYFQMYESGKAALRPHVGAPKSYAILNRW